MFFVPRKQVLLDPKHLLMLDNGIRVGPQVRRKLLVKIKRKHDRKDMALTNGIIWSKIYIVVFGDRNGHFFELKEDMLLLLLPCLLSLICLTPFGNETFM